MQRSLVIDESWWRRPGVATLTLAAQAALLRLEYVTARAGGSMLSEMGEPLDRDGVVAAVTFMAVPPWEAENAVEELERNGLLAHDLTGSYWLQAGVNGKAAKPPKPKPEPPRSTAPVVEIPPALKNSVEFMDAWAGWLDYRRRRRKTNDPATLCAHLALLAPCSAASAVAMIRKAISGGWATIYPMDGGQKRGGEKTAQRKTSYDY